MILEELKRHALEKRTEPCIVHWSDETCQTISFEECDRISDRLSAAVKANAGIGSRVVLIVLKHHLLQLPLFLGCMKAGLIPCFLPFPSTKQDPFLFWRTQAAVLQRIDAALIVTYAELIDRVRALAETTGVSVADIDELNRCSDASAMSLPDEGDIALLQHSSGTTGLNKGVALSHRQISAQIQAYAAVAQIDHRSVIVSWLPYYHDMGLFTGFLIPVSLGATVVCLDAFEWVHQPRSVLELAQRFRATHCWMPNFAFNHILNTISDEQTFDLRSLTMLVNCSEPVKPATLQRFAERFASSGLALGAVKACYAMAEACFAVSQTVAKEQFKVGWYDSERLERKHRAVRCEPDAPAARAYVSNGPAIEGVEMRIRSESDASGANAIGAAVGEIELRGRFVFSGYYRNEDATAAAFDGGWYRTGDNGFVDQGELFVVGRRKDVLIVHGRNYYAHDIEAIVSSTAGINPGRVVAIGVPNDDSGTEDAVILAETDEPGAAYGAIRREVKRALYSSLGLTPSLVELKPRGWLVKTTSGKISRTHNVAKYLDTKREMT
jgi:acyl-CoA synthetase (AMP-forming)/AMP-acid ligase II